MANTSRTRLLPTRMIDYLSDTLPTFAGYPPQLQRATVALMLSAASPTRFKHHLDPDAATIHYTRINNWFGNRARFNKVNDELGGIFHVSADWKWRGTAGKGETKRYYITEFGASLIDAATTLTTTGMMTMEGVRIRKPAEYGILSKDSDGNTRRGKGNLPSVIPIDRPALEELRTELRHQKDAYVDYLTDGIPPPDCAHAGIQKRLTGFATDHDALNWLRTALYQINALLTHIDVDYLPRNTMECIYQEYPSGRLFAAGLSLQNVMREIRRAALRGMWDADISNCHPSLLLQMALRQGREMPNLLHYLENKKAIREQIAHDVGISYDDAKQSLVAIMYGVRRSLWKESAIPELIGPEKAQRLYQHPSWSCLVDEVRSVRDVIIKAAPRNRGRIINAMGKGLTTFEGPRRQINQEMAHLCQGAEAACLNAIIEAFGPELVLLQHDGWTMRKMNDPATMEKAIFEKTGFTVDIEITQC